MRITFALPDVANLSGGLRVVSQYTRHLLQQGHQVSFAVRRPRYAPSRKRKLLNLTGLGRPTPPLAPNIRRAHANSAAYAEAANRIKTPPMTGKTHM